MSDGIQKIPPQREGLAEIQAFEQFQAAQAGGVVKNALGNHDFIGLVIGAECIQLCLYADGCANE